MSSVKTRQELIEQVLEDLGVVGEGQTAQPEQIERVNGVLDPGIAQMRGEEIFYLNDVDNVPEQVFLPIAAVIAWYNRAKFGVTGDDLIVLKSGYDEAIISLKKQSRGRATYQPLRTEYF